MADNVKRLIEQLTERGVQNPALERLRERTGVRARSSALANLQHEVLGEMAAALGRSGERVDEALLSLEACRHDLDQARRAHAASAAAGSAAPAAIVEAVDRFNAQREVVLKHIENLKIHREVFGLRNHAMVDQVYPVPEPER